MVSSWTRSPLCQVRIRSCGGVNGVGRNQRGSNGGEAVAALGPDVGALVRVAEVVDAEVVGRGNPLDVAPGILEADTAGGLADHQGDLALVAEQFATGRALNRAGNLRGAERQGRGRLQEVRRLLRSTSALGSTAGVIDVDGNDLARPGQHVLADFLGPELQCHGASSSSSVIKYEIVYDNYDRNVIHVNPSPETQLSRSRARFERS